MLEHYAKLGEDGRILIPLAFRRKLHLKPGGIVVLRLENETIRVVGLKHSIHQAQKLVQGHAKNKSLVKLLKSMRNKDAQDE